MIDLHCHLLPGIDDGPGDLAAAIDLARAQVAAGVGLVAATPHAIARFPNDAATVAVGVADLRAALDREDVPLEVAGGAELDLAHALALTDEQLAGLSLGGRGWLLLEAPLTAVAPLEEGVAALRARGFQVLLAHPERAPMLQREPEIVDRLVRAGVRTQLTAGGLGGQFGTPVRRFAERLLDAGLAHTFASDAHDVRRRPPGLAGPLEAVGLGGAVPLLCEHHPAAVLAGESLPREVPLRRRGGLLRRLRGR